MGKRRRERDRPKNIPDSSYNPNKRVLLSYASDEGDADGDSAGAADYDDRKSSPEPTLPPDEVVAGHQIAEYGDDSDDDDNGDDEEDLQKQDDSLENNHPPAKSDRGANRHSGQQKKHNGKQNVKKNLTTNQFPALGFAVDQWDGEERDDGEQGTDDEAMAYLRSVRTEREGIPLILRSSEHLDASLPDQDPCVISSGVCAAPIAAQDAVSTTDEAVISSDPQQVFTDALIARFLQYRQMLCLPTTADKIAELDDQHPISCPSYNKKASAEWTQLLSTANPLPAQLRSLDSESVFTLLDLIRERLLVQGQVLNNMTSSWLWSLLARLDDVGCMNNDDVFKLRQLAKQALLVQFSLTDPVTASQLEAYQAGDNGDVSADSTIKHDQAPATLPNNSSPTTETADSPAIVNTLATLDMTLVVIGQVFGQRDIYEHRRSWIAVPAQGAKDPDTKIP